MVAGLPKRIGNFILDLNDIFMETAPNLFWRAVFYLKDEQEDFK
jgi:hypothetical protein